VGKLRTEVVRPDPLIAPIAKGAAVGTLKVFQGDRLVAERALEALNAVPEAGLLGRAWDAIRLWIK
jgi:D-alanyl-D-alanine carboxypeptidase (penicillin-binding protein 5/6)